MSADIECRQCGMDLEQWNNEQNVRILYCPYCGKKLLKSQSDALYRKATVEEISDMIKERVLECLEWVDGGASADELGYSAWEAENCDGVVFYDNYKAERFVARHHKWVDDAMDCVCDHTGEAGHYTKMKAECNDRFLVVAFIYATEHFLFDQLGIDRNEGDLSKKRIKEIIRMVKTTDYDGKF